jgi:predicted alpha/beta hydrolase family esterase
MRQTDRLRIALAIQWGAGAVAGLAWFSLPWWLLPPVAIGLAAIGVAVVLGAEFLVAAAVDPVRAGGAQSGRAWLAWFGETIAHLHAFWVLQPFQADDGRRSADGTDRPAVLLIHGFSCNRAVWLPLIGSGKLDGCHVETVDLSPACGSIEGQATQIDAAVRSLKARSGARQVALVAHSMGGLAALAYLRRFGHDSVRTAIALAVPFGGTLMANLLACPAARQMRPGNAWLKQLIDAIEPQARGKIVCFACRDDNIIVPRAAATLPGARQVLVAGVGHLALTCDPHTWAAIADLVGRTGQGP